MATRTFARTAVLAGAIATIALSGIRSADAAGAAPGTVTLTNDLVTTLATDTNLGAAPSSAPMTVSILLTHDLTSMYAYEQQLYTPGSALYHHFLTPAQVREQWGTDPSTVAAVRAFGTSHGLSLVNPDLMYDNVELTGSTAQVEATFGVTEDSFVTGTGQAFIANVDEPTVPAGLGINVVSGLETLDRFKSDAAFPSGAPAGDSTPAADQACVPDPASDSGNICTAAYDPQDLWSAYNQPGDNFGEGQSIGIIGAGQTGDVIAALRDFESTRGLPTVPVQVYYTEPLGGTPDGKLDDSGKGEWELDTQASSGMAPHISQLRMYFAVSADTGGIIDDLTAWANDPNGPLQANASVGIQEDSPVISAITTQGKDDLAKAAMEGRTLFASTGDVATGCSYPLPGVNGVTNGAPPDCWPAVDPNAVGVGGTSLDTDGATHPQRVDEHSWEHTGGGPSHFTQQPSYQANASPLLETNVCAGDGSGNPYPPGTLCRGISDVASLSGDDTVVTYTGTGPVDGYNQADATCTYDSNGAITGCTYSNFPDGGTSLSSPLWAGMWARVQAHHDSGNTPANSLGLATPLIYKLGTGSTTYPRDFFDVVEGDNGYPDGPGWDFPSGWGVPNVTNLIEDASGDGTTAALSSVEPSGPDPAPIYTSGGSSGGQATAPACDYAIWDPSNDATDTLGASIPQLDITQLTFGLSSDNKSLRVVFNIQNLSNTIPTPWTTDQYQAWWSEGSSVYAVDAEVNAAGVWLYQDGTFQVVSAPAAGNQYQYVANPTSAATGSNVPGPNGTVEVDVPLTDIGSPAAGSTLGAPNAGADEADGTGSASQGFVVDLDGPGNSYTLGDPSSCLNSPAANVPEAPIAPLLIVAGVGTTAILTRRPRRGGRAR